MQAEWIQRVGSSVPRGFSRHFILETLKKKPHTGKEIIDFAIKQTEGKWKPSPGLIYPLLGRLLDEKLIQETVGGKYKITKRGAITTDDLETINNIVKNQLDVLLEESEKYPVVCGLSLHTFIIGQPFRFKYLKKMLEYVKNHKKKKNIWYTRPGEIADYVYKKKINQTS